MKRFASIITIIFFSNTLHAQVASLTNAILYYNEGNLIKAKEEIDKADVNEKTIVMPKTWFYTGVIYKDIYQASTTDGQAENVSTLIKSIDAFQKVFKLEKTPSEFSRKSTEALDQIWGISINRGVKLYQAQNFTSALTDFDRAQSIKPADTTAYVYALYAANALDNNDLLESYASKLVALNYSSDVVYYTQIGLLIKKNLLDSALVTSTIAAEKYPLDVALKTQQIELLVKMNKSLEAIENLKVLSDKNPNDIQLLLNIGSQYGNLKDEVQAETYFKKVIALDSTNYIANFNMSVYSLNRALTTVDKIIAYDNEKHKTNRSYYPNPETDPLRIALRNELKTTKLFVNKAKVINESEQKNVTAVLENIKSMEERFLK
jgi:tetratricopeptide (TPR) repeat protein